MKNLASATKAIVGDRWCGLQTVSVNCASELDKVMSRFKRRSREWKTAVENSIQRSFTRYVIPLGEGGYLDLLYYRLTYMESYSMGGYGREEGDSKRVNLAVHNG